MKKITFELEFNKTSSFLYFEVLFKKNKTREETLGPPSINHLFSPDECRINGFQWKKTVSQ